MSTMSIDLIKLAEFYTHPDEGEFDSIGPLDVTAVWCDDTRRIFVVSFWVQAMSGGRHIQKLTYSTYSDAISAALNRSGWGTWEDMVRYEQDEVG